MYESIHWALVKTFEIRVMWMTMLRKVEAGKIMKFLGIRNGEYWMSVATLHIYTHTHAKVNYSQTDTHIHLPPLPSPEKTTRLPFTLQMTQVFSIQH